MARDSAKEIDEAAAQWMARLDRGLSESEQQGLLDWLAGDDRRVGAWARMRALSAHTERAAGLGVDYRPEQFRHGSSLYWTRRHLLQSGLAALGTAAAATGGAIWLMNVYGHYVTRKGEVRVVALADGSVMTLNTQSSVSVRYSKERRLIKLLDGEALFEVSKDAARPFVVSAGALEARAVGTLFTVSRLPHSPVQVLVEEGVVDVGKATAPLEALRLSANMRATEAVGASGAVAVAPVPVDQVRRELIWREGRLIFEGEPLDRAAAQFARYSDTRILIDDADLPHEEISGSYQANDPVGFSRAVAEALRARIEVSANEVRLYR